MSKEKGLTDSEFETFIGQHIRNTYEIALFEAIQYKFKGIKDLSVVYGSIVWDRKCGVTKKMMQEFINELQNYNFKKDIDLFNQIKIK